MGENINQPNLFMQIKSKKEQLYDYIKKCGRCRTSDVIRWGSLNQCNTADRLARELAEEKKIWRMSDRMKLCSQFAKSKELIWSIFKNDLD